MATYIEAPGVRRLSDADAEAVYAIARAGDIADIGEPDLELSEITWDLGLDTSEWWGVDAPDGGLLAYAGAFKRPEHTTTVGEVRTGPDVEPAVGPPLVRLARQVAGRLDPDVPLHLFVHVSDATRQGWFTDAGARIVRHFWRMVIDFDASPVWPALPPDVDVRVVGDDEKLKRLTHEVIDVAFRDHFGHDAEQGSEWEEFIDRTHAADGFDDTLWWIAFVDEAPAAAAVCRTTPTGGYVDSLGTLRDHRGRGLGRLLLQTAFAEFGRRGHTRVTLGVDAANPTGAVRLYESVGMRADQEWVVYEVEPLTT